MAIEILPTTAPTSTRPTTRTSVTSRRFDTPVAEADTLVLLPAMAGG